MRCFKLLSLCLMMMSAVLGRIAKRADCDPLQCNTSFLKHYYEMGCRPIHHDGNCCPSNFDCSAYFADQTTDKCVLEGIKYDIDSQLTTKETKNPCLAACICKKFGNAEKASFNCADVECFGDYASPLAPNCHRIYSSDQCCSTGVKCYDDNQAKSEAGAKVECELEGKKYKEGETFYPENFPCKTCICKEGFEGKLEEPFCSESSCAFDLKHRSDILNGCVPVYYSNKTCCSIEWRCPSSNDTAVHGNKPGITVVEGGAASQDTCRFGDLNIKVSDTVYDFSEKFNICIDCSCEKPPMISCRKNLTCYHS